MGVITLSWTSLCVTIQPCCITNLFHGIDNGVGVHTLSACVYECRPPKKNEIFEIHVLWWLNVAQTHGGSDFSM